MTSNRTAAQTELLEQLQRIEARLLDPAVRADPQQARADLAEEFVEFGAAGEIFDRATILARLMADRRPPLGMTQFRLRAASDTVAVTSCRVRAADGRETLRSSTWIQRDGRWQMVFHQGTQAAGVDEGTS